MGARHGPEVPSQDRRGWFADSWGADLQERLEEVSLMVGGHVKRREERRGFYKQGTASSPFS